MNNKASNAVYDKSLIWLIILYFLMIINYKGIISEYFSYEGFKDQYFTVFKFFISICSLFFILFLYKRIRVEFYKIIYSIYIILIFYGQSIFYMFNDAHFILVLYSIIPMLILYFFQRYSKLTFSRDIKLKLSDKFAYYVLIIITIIMILPYLKNLKYLNVNNLFLQDIYLTRSIQAGSLSGLLGYLFSPITRVILPFIFIYSLESKNRIMALFLLTLVILMFLLNGALKSILFGIAATYFFYKGNYRKKEARFLKVMITINIFSLFELILNNSYHIADYLRRVIFVPSYLFEVYYDVYNSNYTLFLHSRLSKLLGINEYSDWIPLFIGENILGRRGLAANVGIFTEGFFSFGFIGVVLGSIIFAYVIKYLYKRQLSSAYFGIIFTYIYIINTSFIETLFITHGLLLYLIFARFIIPKEKTF